MNVYGRDVSKWNPDYAPKKDEAFVMIRAGYGKNNIDPLAEQHYLKAKAAGLRVGFYWFSYAYTAKMAEDEAKYLLDFVADKNVSMPLAWDYEYDSMRKHPPASSLVDMATAFCEAIESAHYFATIYTNKDYLRNHWASLEGTYNLWLADYKLKSGAIVPGKIDMVQMTSTYSVENKNYDRNVTTQEFLETMNGFAHYNDKGMSVCDCDCSCCIRKRDRTCDKEK